MTPQELAQIYALAFPESRPWDAVEFETLMQSKFCFTFGDSRGFGLGRVVAGESELITIAVVPKFQGQGIGRDLLSHYHHKALNLGAVTFFLEVSSDNKKAISLYRSDGYKEKSRRENYYRRQNGTTADALIMTKDAASSP